MNIGDLGQDLEHCLKLRKQLREFRGVWAGVRRPCLGEVGQHIPALGATAQSTDRVWALEPHVGSSGSSTLSSCTCLGRLPHLAEP